ncbi:HAUS augmin-like complex subunit 8 [Scomber scombrus]|uniref:HAUS augmin-like complex subunit 8 n=1 Tax=Scomber scombrus TaxID=13677 RepID=A0AAV1N8M8_SCOSC|nr:HAUS augmin-like complex subunit 8 [Scomber scombrus]
MASRRRTTAVPSTFKNPSTEPKSSKSVNPTNKANNSGNGAAKNTSKPSGTAVKSRYMQSAEKSSLSKSISRSNDSGGLPSSPKPSGVKPKVGNPLRQTMTPQALGMSMMSRETEPSLLGKSVLQSTFSDGHCFRPDFDISVIKDKTVKENAVEPERNPEIQKTDIEMQTFLLAYLTAKMESNTAKLKAEAEARILQMMEEEEVLRNEVYEKKRQYLFMEKDRNVNELLDLQIAALTPVAEAAKHFTKEYKSFATAIDTTRHELPVKNFYIDGDRSEFLNKAEPCLKESEKLLVECTGDHKDNSTSLECLREMKMASKDISQQLSGAFSELLELSSLVCRHTIHIQQASEEEQLGTARTQELYCTKN